MKKGSFKGGVCKVCKNFCVVDEQWIFKNETGHHPNCPVVNEKKATIKISDGGSGFVTQDISEIQYLLENDSYEVGDKYIIEFIEPMSIKEIYELPEFEGF